MATAFQGIFLKLADPAKFIDFERYLHIENYMWQKFQQINLTFCDNSTKMLGLKYTKHNR